MSRDVPPAKGETMTLEEFLTRLQQTPRDWVLRKYSNHPYDRIRRVGRFGQLECPISPLMGEPIELAYQVAKKLGLPITLIGCLIAAADGNPGCDMNLRAQLLAAVRDERL